MPGVPPDAIAQVKRGLRGLFNRKKRSQAGTQSSSSAPQQGQQQQAPTETKNAPQNPTITTTAPSPSPGQTPEEGHVGKKNAEDGFPPPPPGAPPGNNGIDSPSPQHISSPTGIQEAKDINLDPSSTPTKATAATTSAPRPTTESDVKPPTETSTTEAAQQPDTAEPKTVATSAVDSEKRNEVDHNGMSATSGPLDDSAMMFGDGRGSADGDGRQFLEKERDLEDDRPKEEVEEEGEKKLESAKPAAAV